MNKIKFHFYTLLIRYFIILVRKPYRINDLLNELFHEIFPYSFKDLGDDIKESYTNYYNWKG